MALFLPFFVGLFVYFIPHSASIDSKGWTLLSIFIATIVGSITKPFPMGTVSLCGLLVAILSGCLQIKESLSSLSSPLIWMVIFVFLIARGFSATPLGERIAYTFVRLLGKRTLGLGYGIVFSELLIAPVVPSSGARCGGVIYPVVKAIAKALGSAPEDKTKKRLGAFLTQVCFQGNGIVSAMFLTSMAANPLMQSMAQKQGVTITWGNWLLCSCVPGLVSLLLMPLIIYWIDPPELKKLPESIKFAKTKLISMGPMTRNEKIMLSVFGIMLSLWVFAKTVDPCTTALLGLVILLLSGVLKWNELLAEHEAWHTLIWLSTLITMSSYLQKYGIIDHFSDQMSLIAKGNIIGVPILVLIYFYSHYLFASNTAHASAMYAAFLAVSLNIGGNPLLMALSLGFCTSLFGGLTHYSSSAAPILFSSNYVSLKTWWKTGFIMSLVNLFVWFGIGSIWWKILGYW